MNKINLELIFNFLLILAVINLILLVWVPIITVLKGLITIIIVIIAIYLYSKLKMIENALAENALLKKDEPSK